MRIPTDESTEPGLSGEALPEQSENNAEATADAEPLREPQNGLSAADGGNLSAESRYERQKKRDLEKLEEEIRQRNLIDTKKKRRNWWIKTVLMLVMIVVAVVLVFTITQYLSEDSLKSFNSMLAGASLPFFLLYLGAIALFIIVEGAKYSYLLKISTGKFRLKTSLKVMFLGKYYDFITPLGTGGQPFQIHYLHKKDIPAGAATAIPLVRFMVTTVVLCIFAVALLIITPIYVPSKLETVTAQIVAWVMVGINFLLPFGILFVSLFPRAGKRLIAWIVFVLNKLHIVRHKYPTMKKYLIGVEEYQGALRLLIQRWYKLIPLVVICLIESILYVSLPFFAVLAIEGADVTENLWLLYLQIACLTIVSYYSSNWVPTPGNVGANEVVATIVFLTLAGLSSSIGWIVLLWRFSTFYIFLLSGIGISIFEIIRSYVRRKRAEKLSKQ